MTQGFSLSVILKLFDTVPQSNNTSSLTVKCRRKLLRSEPGWSHGWEFAILSNGKDFFTESGWSGIGTAVQGAVRIHIPRNIPHPQKRSRNIWTWHLVLYGLVDMVVVFGQRLDLISEVFSNDSKCVFNLSSSWSAISCVPSLTSHLLLPPDALHQLCWYSSFFMVSGL